MRPQEPYEKQFVQYARQAKRCDWCGRDRPKKRPGSCRHCNEVHKNLERIQKRFPKPKTFTEKWSLKLAQEKKKQCLAWGAMVRGIFGGPVTPLDLGCWFCLIEKRITKDEKKLRGEATTLGWIFTPEQRQVLAYLFWKILGEHASRHRQAFALSGSHKWNLSDASLAGKP